MTSESDPVFELGKSLADALDPSDIVGRWMAHHLADLISRSEAHPADQELAREAREVILKLWEHKAGGRFKTTPYQHVQPVLAALARLEPDPPPWSHFRTFSPEEFPPASDLARYPVLAVACDMDREFGHLVRLAVALAAQEALDREEAWVVAATAVAGTEADDVMQKLQKMIQAFRDTALPYDSAPADEPFEPDDQDQAQRSETSKARSSGHPRTDDEVFVASLRVAIARCTEMLERLDQISVGSSVTSVPQTSEVAEQPSEGSC